MYGPVPEEKFPIPAVDVSKIDPKYYRRTVKYDTDEAAGTIIVDPGKYYVYRVEGDGNATRYGANVGRQGFLWSGDADVGRKAEWPIWTPPREMIQRQPEAAKYAGGMAPGLDNPLGARTLYLYPDGVYTIYSTSDPETIGTNLTSGCTGLLSQDMIDLYSRTPVKTRWSSCRPRQGVSPRSRRRRAGGAFGGCGGDLPYVRATPLRTSAACRFLLKADGLESANSHHLRPGGALRFAPLTPPPSDNPLHPKTRSSASAPARSAG